MVSYLNCMKANAGNNSQCRPESKSYLQCRMDKSVSSTLSSTEHRGAELMCRGLMQRDDMGNLGFRDVADGHVQPGALKEDAP